MDWIKLVIPLIAVAVWILSNLAKNREEPRRQRTAPPPKPEEGSGPRRRRTPTEVDQFLEEVRRRREAAEGRSPPKPVPPPLPVEPERVLTKNRPVPTSKGPAAPPILAKVVPVLEPIAASPIITPRTTVVPVSPLVKETLALLQNRKSLATAILLREILEQPLCRRPQSIPARRK